MSLIAHIDPKRLSHAYVIEAEREVGLLSLREFMNVLGVTTTGNPDYHEYLLDSFLIDDARELRRAQSLHGAAGAKKIFIVAFRMIGIESQHALLKTLEEPTADTHFFFVVRTNELFLPTVRSRVQTIRLGSGEIPQEKDAARVFVGASIPERLKFIEKMTKAKTDDKAEAKEEARLFLSDLEPVLYGKLADGRKDVARSLEDIVVAQRELAGRAPSVKFLLEHLALTIPTV
jgi:DNA polymerase III delta prime subunit